MKQENIEKYFNSKSNNLSMKDKSRLSEMRYNVFNNKRKKHSRLFKPVYASVLALIPVFFLSINNSERVVEDSEYNQIIELAYLNDSDILSGEYSDDEFSVENDYNLILTMTGYTENQLDLYY